MGVWACGRVGVWAGNVPLWGNCAAALVLCEIREICGLVS
jgi:hypothetical protein